MLHTASILLIAVGLYPSKLGRCSIHFQAHMQGEDAGIFQTETSAADGGISELLTDILRHFSATEFIEILRSICRRAVARASDTAGMNLHKVCRRVAPS